MNAEEMRRAYPAREGSFLQLLSSWERSRCTAHLRARLAFVFISKLYRQSTQGLVSLQIAPAGTDPAAWAAGLRSRAASSSGPSNARTANPARENCGAGLIPGNPIELNTGAARAEKQCILALAEEAPRSPALKGGSCLNVHCHEPAAASEGEEPLAVIFDGRERAGPISGEGFSSGCQARTPGKCDSGQRIPSAF